MPARWSLRTDRLVGCFLQYQFLTSGWILRRQWSIHKELQRKQSLLVLDWQGLILNEVQVVLTRFECTMPSRAKLPTEHSSWWVPWDIISNPFYDRYCHKPNNGELISKILLYEFELITKKCGMCVTMLSFYQLRFMGSKVHWTTTVHGKEDGYTSPSFCRRSLLPPIFTMILCFIGNHPLNWLVNYHHLFVHIQCERKDLIRRQPIWLDWLGCLAHNNAQMTMWVHQIIMLEIHQAKTLNSGNPQIKFIHHRGIVFRPRSHHFQVLPRSTTMPHSVWLQAHNQALVEPKDIWVMGHCGKHMISP